LSAGVTITQEQDYALRRSQEAQYLLQNPMLIDAFQAMHDHYMTGWMHTDPSNPGERELIYHRIQALDAVKKQLQSYINEGMIVDRAIELETQQRAHGAMDGSPDLQPGIA
jgi:hypothetical protein